MRKRIIGLVLLAMTTMAAAQSLDECQQAAERNYPMIRHLDLIARTTDMTVANIGKGLLPQVTVSAQATLQSEVTSWPTQMQAMLSGMGVDVEGMKKGQYRVGIDLAQTLYDGGAVRSRRQVARAEGEAEAARTEVSLYQVRRRVNEMYFALLLLDQQIALNADLQQLLDGSEQQLLSMYRHGTAAESDHLSVKAERLKATQQMTDLEACRLTLSRMLSALCGTEVTRPVRPTLPEAAGTPAAGRRPELRAVSSRLRLADAREQALNATLRPRLSLFAQGWYGYPGLNLFDDMMRRRWSLNGIVGARLSWDIGPLYTLRGDKARIRLERASAATDRDVFTFDNDMEQIRHNDDMARYRRLMDADAEIISLTAAVRVAAESKLRNGIIDVNALVREINNENAARVRQAQHEIEMLKAAFDLLYATGQ